MESIYIYWVILEMIYLIICFFIKRNKNYKCNYEILWPLANIAYLAGERGASAKQISYFSGAVLILVVVYFFALDLYKQLKNKN